MEEKKDISEQDVWTILEEEGLTQYLGITKDEFYFLAELNQKKLSEEELKAHLLAYRNYQKYRNNENNDVQSDETNKHNEG